MPLTAEELRRVLSYEPSSGVWTWATDVGRRIKAGQTAGCGVHKSGYRQIGVGGRLYLSHRLAWLYMTGVWPDHEVDHIDGVPGNDRWSNLRAATVQQNRRNRRVRSDSSTGVRGVQHHRGLFRARIFVQGRSLSLGSYKTVDEAQRARNAAENLYFGEFSSLHRGAGSCASAPASISH